MLRLAIATASFIFSVLFSSQPCAQGLTSNTTTQSEIKTSLSVEDFFRDALFASAVLSPSGGHVAFLVREPKGRAKLATLDVATMKPTVVAAFEQEGIQNVRWVNDKRITFTLAAEESGPGLFAVDADGENFRQLIEVWRSWLRQPQGARAPLSPQFRLAGALPQANHDDVLVWRHEENSNQKNDFIQMLRLNTRSGATRELDVPKHMINWLFNADGELQAAVERKGPRDTLFLRDAQGNLSEAANFNRSDVDKIWPRSLNRDGSFLVESNAGRDKSALYRVEAMTGKLIGEPIHFNPDFDLYPELLMRDGQLIGLRYDADGQVTHWFDAQMRVLQAEIDKLLPVTANRVSVPARGDSKVALIVAYSDRQPAVTYLLNLQTKKLSKLGASQPHIEPKTQSEMDFVKITARDGLRIPTYITMPAGKAKKNLPMIVLVHGGPWLRGQSWRWDREVQFLASRGYVVLEPQFRGSTGFGMEHFKKGWKQWGLAMQDDLADAASWAVKEGIADPKRICIAGASYGGYAAMMGLIAQPELFRCGINWVGVSDIDLLFNPIWSDANEESKRYGMKTMIGDPEKDAPQFKATSPIANAHKIKQPIFLAYGERDQRVPLVHGTKLRDAVKAHNSNVEWISYANEGHGGWRTETKIDFWTRIDAFLTKHNPAN